MLQLLTLFTLALSLVNGLTVPDVKSNDGPSPLKLDFSISKTVGNSTAREFWAKSRSGAKRDAFSEVLTDFRDLSYTMDIYLGSERIRNTVIIDTGSSDLWVPQSGYNPRESVTARDTGIPFSIGYLDGSQAQGQFYQDTLQLATSYSVLPGFTFAHSSSTDQGILGIGDKLTESTVNQGIVYDNLPYALQKAGITSKASYSLYLSPNHDTGSLIFGGLDTEKYVGDLTTYNIDKERGGLAVRVQSIDFNGQRLVNTGGFVLDSGSTLGLLKRPHFDALAAEFGGQPFFEGQSEFRIVDCNQPSDKSIDFNFGRNIISIPYSDAVKRNDDGSCMLGFGWNRDEELLGDVFLRHAYVYYDLTDQMISLAKASFSPYSNIVNA